MTKIQVVEVDDNAVLLLQGAMYGDEWIDLVLAEAFHKQTKEALEDTNVKVLYLPKEIDVKVLNIKK